jgi:hypothetical protein
MSNQPRGGRVNAVQKGDRFIWGDENHPAAVQVTITRVARDGSWADILCTTGGATFWSKRQRLPFPATFRRVVGGCPMSTHLAQRAEARYASEVDTERALRLLRALGDTGDQVADRLRTLGITGGQRLSHICPVAQYMAACRVPCFIGDTVFALAGHPDTWLPLPEPVIRFVWQFDAGIHLDLIDGGPA